MTAPRLRRRRSRGRRRMKACASPLDRRWRTIFRPDGIARAFRKNRPGMTLFDDMPQSSEQILHPALYLNDDAPTIVGLPALSGVTVAHQNTVGEFTTRLFLYEHLRDQAAAISGAGGWDGDRYALVRSARGEGLIWVSVWDSSIDAGDFYNLMDRTIDRRYGPSPAR